MNTSQLREKFKEVFGVEADHTLDVYKRQTEYEHLAGYFKCFL